VKPAERAVIVGIVLAVAVALRWGFVATSYQHNPLRADAGQYAQYAHNLVEHGVYSLATSVPPAPDSFRSPGYPVFLAVCRVLGGDEGWLRLAWVLQVALSSATVLLVYRLARRWLPFAPSLLATALCALSPHLVVSPAYVLTECLTTFLLLAGLSMFAARQERSSAGFGLSALVIGLAVSCNEALVFVPLVLAWPVLRADGWRRALVFVVIALTPMLVWTARNQRDDLALRGSQRITASISHGTYPGMVYEDPRLLGFPYHEDPEQPEFGSSWEKLGTVFARRAGKEPWRYVSWYALEKPVWLWGWDLVQGVGVLVYDVAESPYERQPIMRATHWVMKMLHAPVMILAAAAALVLVWNRRRRFGVVPQCLGLVAVFGTLAYLPVIPDPRYLQPFRPVLFVLTGAAVYWLALTLAARRRNLVADAVGQSGDECGQVAKAQ